MGWEACASAGRLVNLLHSRKLQVPYSRGILDQALCVAEFTSLPEENEENEALIRSFSFGNEFTVASLSMEQVSWEA
jgi:hypothetical protein